MGLQGENSKLKDENSKLKDENSKFKAEIKELKATIKRLTKQLADQGKDDWEGKYNDLLKKNKTESQDWISQASKWVTSNPLASMVLGVTSFSILMGMGYHVGNYFYPSTVIEKVEIVKFDSDKCPGVDALDQCQSKLGDMTSKFNL